MSLRMIIALLSLSLLSACATTDNHQQPYMGTDPNQEHTAGNDLYNANKKVQQPQSTSWGWQSNQN